MIRTSILLVLLLPLLAFCLEGPDLMLLGDCYIPGPGGFNLCSAEPQTGGMKLTLQNASLYDIRSLDWNYAGIRYSSGCWTIAGDFRMYGVNSLYESDQYQVMIHYLFVERLSIGAGYGRKELNFGDGLYKTSINILRFSSGFKLDNFSLDLTVDNIALNDDDKAVGDPEYLFSGAWPVYRELTVYSIYYRNPYKHDRFLLGQDLKLNKHLNINAGLISGPEVYFVGLEIVYKGLVFGYTYYDVAGLPDCSKLTLNYR